MRKSEGPLCPLRFIESLEIVENVPLLRRPPFCHFCPPVGWESGESQRFRLFFLKTKDSDYSTRFDA